MSKKKKPFTHSGRANKNFLASPPLITTNWVANMNAKRITYVGPTLQPYHVNGKTVMLKHGDIIDLNEQ